MRLLVAGDRFWTDRDYLYAVLDRFHAKYHVDVLIEGEAPGADTMAREWAKSRGVLFEPYPADWDNVKPRKRAGTLRNEQMLREGKPDYVLAFHRNPPVSKGTKHMVKIASEAGLPFVWLPSGLGNLTLFKET